MERVLNQEEIDAIVRAARTGEPAQTAGDTIAHVETWDVKSAGQIGREQLQAITQLHENFARNLTNSLGAFLRVVFSATLVSAEHLTYREFLQGIPDMTYLASCHLHPLEGTAVLQVDLKVAFPMIDLLLGGEGKSLPTPREITEIEEQILDSVSRIICRELGIAWQALPLEASFGTHLDTSEALRLMPPNEKVLSLSFEIEMPDSRGTLIVAMPATASSALLRKISVDWSKRRPGVDDNTRRRLMARLQHCSFEIGLEAKSLRTSVAALTALKVGELLTFSRRVEEGAHLGVEDVNIFRAVPARIGDTRAARVLGTMETRNE